MNMTETTDLDLLRTYARTHSDDAFGLLVQRHIPLVHAAALRICGSGSESADVAQAVFLDLARKAGSLPPETVLPGWLHRAATYHASKRVRSERRRAVREREALRRLEMNSSPPDDSPGLLPLLDEVLQRLPAGDRDALVLRFLAERNYRAVGESLGISEEAARKRVDRAVERLRTLLAAQGHGIPTATVVAALGMLGESAAPAALAGSVTATVSAVVSAGTGGAAELWTMKELAALVFLALAAGSVAVQSFGDRPTAAPSARGIGLAEVAVPGPAARAGGSEADELQALEQEARRLQQVLATRRRPPPVPAARGESPVKLVPGVPVLMSDLGDAGMATPEAALQSTIAASLSLDLHRIIQLSLLPPEETARVAEEADSLRGSDRLDQLLREREEQRVRGDTIELLKVVPDGADRMALTVVVRVPGQLPTTSTLTFGRTAAGWKSLPVVNGGESSVIRETSP